jgi:hypothetical protein
LVERKEMGRQSLLVIGIEKAIEQHKDRTPFYEQITQVEAFPIIVTIIEEEIQVYEGVPIVPVNKLDSFFQRI